MKQTARPQEQARSSLLETKRAFLLNLGLFICLIFGWVLLPDSQEHQTSPVERSTARFAHELYSLSEFAYLTGQIVALNTRSESMPDFETEWAIKLSRQELRQRAAFSQIESEEFESLAREFLKGYAERYDEYYDDAGARELGYNYGLKFDPEIYGMLPFSTLNRLLKDRNQIERKFPINDEAEWLCFCRAFDNGFVEGYSIIQEGITYRTRRPEIQLFDK
ncbi:MAG TPA: hypothetical protein DEA90_10900 [Opitutae bacterium]|nr:hypothetical protein [Puniceicoccaceae bacterium]HBR94660.1 hypothetical protein [Opitutae bacterium]|tara:strand:- start:163 stop:825 length:663 start_codon:yes stop_codon:yes gene_type:complete